MTEQQFFEQELETDSPEDEKKWARRNLLGEAAVATVFILGFGISTLDDFWKAESWDKLWQGVFAFVLAPYTVFLLWRAVLKACSYMK